MRHFISIMCKETELVANSKLLCTNISNGIISPMVSCVVVVKGRRYLDFQGGTL